MEALNPSTTGTPPRLTRNHVLALLLGTGTFLTFGVERALYVATGQQLGDLPAILMGLITATVGVGAFYTTIKGNDFWAAISIAFGPVGGFALYLLGYHLVLPPSTDSPTWLIFLAFAGAFIALGGVAHLLGRLVRATT